MGLNEKAEPSVNINVERGQETEPYVLQKGILAGLLRQLLLVALITAVSARDTQGNWI